MREKKKVGMNIMYKKPLTRNQLERKISSYKKEAETMGEWFDKKQEQFDKNIKIVQDKGFFKEISLELVNEDNKSEYFSKMYDEIEKASKSGATKTLVNKMWAVEGLVSSWADKLRSRKTVIRLIEKYETELMETYGELTEEQLKDKKELEEEKALYNRLKNELDEIDIESLNEWLANYKKGYEEWVNEAYKGWKKTVLLQDSDKVVREQKLTIIAKSFPKVGKLEDIKMGTLGMDGTFNGFAIGEKGTCRIETILAGGYNVQRLHYRVLVK